MELRVLVACWSVKGGVGVSTVAAGIAAAIVSSHGCSVLIADLCGDQALLHGVGTSATAGLRGWTRAGSDVPHDALARLEQAIDEDRSLLVPGEPPWAIDRARALGQQLGVHGRAVVADVGREIDGAVGRAVVEEADRSVLVVRACPLSMRAVAELPMVPDAVVLVRDPRRPLRWTDIADRCGAPVVAELDLDPVVGASIDAGVVSRPFPRRYVRALEGVA